MMFHRVLTPGMDKLIVNDSSFSTEQSGNKYLQGEYKLIHQLCQLLDQGRSAKQLADRCIDACAHLQNLREAIYDHKVRLSHPIGLTHEQIKETESRGLHYLLRYFYLVVFAEYLLEEHRQANKAMEKSFLVWLAERREITNLTLKNNLSFE